MAESILVTGKKISSMELVTNVTGNEKIPTGQPDDLAVTPNQIADHTIARGDLVSQEDLSQVEVSLGTQITDLANDVTSADNSIRGLIAAEEAARIAADNLKVDKEGSVSSVAGRVGDVVLAPSDVLVEGFGSQEDVNKYVPKPFLSGYSYGLGERVILSGGEVVKSTIEGNLSDPNVSMVGWVSVISGSLSGTVQTFTTPEAGVNTVTGVAEGAYFNVRSSSDESYGDEYQNVGGAAVATGKQYLSSLGVQLQEKAASTIKDLSGKTQQEINNYFGDRLRHSIDLAIDYGAKGDGVTDSSAAIHNAISAAIATGRPLYIPASEKPYMYRRESLAFSISEVSDNKCLVIYGDGDSSCLKLFDGEITDRFSRSIVFNAMVDMDLIYLRDFKIDNNASNSPEPPPDNPTLYEQSHSVCFRTQAGVTIDTIIVDNILVNDPVADSFNDWGYGKIGTLIYNKIRERNRNRLRATIQLYHTARYVYITDFDGHQIESESIITPSHEKSEIWVSGGRSHTFDILSKTVSDNVHFYVNNHNVEGVLLVSNMNSAVFRGCDLKLNDASRLSYNRNVEFRDCTIRLHFDVVSNASAPLRFYRVAGDQDNYLFEDCRFLIDYVGNLPLGATALILGGATAIPSANVNDHVVTVKNCLFDPRATASVDSYRMGTVNLIGNRYSGTNYGIRWATTAGYSCNLTIDGADMSSVSGNRLLISGVASTGYKLTLKGEWVGGNSLQYTLSTGSLSQVTDYIQNSRYTNSNNLPTSCLLLDVVKSTAITAVVGRVISYICTESSPTAPKFQCYQQLGIYAAPTTSLPTLTDKEVGARAIDTTLNQNKVWSGTQWL